jgi:hypothetical protein
VDIPLALVRILTMMTGELDYEGLFNEQVGKTSTEDSIRISANSTEEGMSMEAISRQNHHPIAAHVWYVCVVIMVTLVLMNLLVGLAVSDIQVRSHP